MEKGIIISFEGTDCSGKEAQSKKLKERLEMENRKVVRFEFPDYKVATGKIVGGPILGKEQICNGWFPETAAKLDPKLWSLYLAADRYYHKEEIEKYIKDGYIVIMDRWVESNMGVQGGKIADKTEREDFWKWEEKLEYEMLGLPRPDLIFFLYMPYEYSKILKSNREEKPDQNEKDLNLQKNAEQSYLELAKYYQLNQINCVREQEIRSILDIHEEIYEVVRKKVLK